MTQRQYRQSPIIIAAVCVSGAAATVSVWRRIRRNSKKKAESRSSAAAAAAAAATGMEALLLSTTPVHKVYLFTFPPVPRVRNISPFSLKVESFLRLYDIPYEMVPTFTFSSKGQMPYIRLNSIDGMEIPDSNVIIDFLTKKFDIGGGGGGGEALLSAEEKAVAHAVTRMVEEHTTQIGFFYRYGLHMEEFNDAVIPTDWFGSEARAAADDLLWCEAQERRQASQVAA